MRGKSPNQLDLYANGHVRHLTTTSWPEVAKRNWWRAIIRSADCRFRMCKSPIGSECRKSGRNSKGGIRHEPHRDRLVRSVERFQDAGGCEICTSIDWMIPRICTCGMVHGICHACWANPMLRGTVPALLSKCPATLTEAESTIISLANA